MAAIHSPCEAASADALSGPAFDASRPSLDAPSLALSRWRRFLRASLQPPPPRPLLAILALAAAASFALHPRAGWLLLLGLGCVRVLCSLVVREAVTAAAPHAAQDSFAAAPEAVLSWGEFRHTRRAGR